MKIKISKKYLIVFSVLLFAIILFLSKTDIIQWINKKIEEVNMASVLDTKINYEIISQDNDMLETLITVENPIGIDKIIMKDMTISCNGKKTVGMDRIFLKDETIQLKIQLSNGEISELYTLMKASVFNVISKEDNIAKLEIEYPNDDNLDNYYSIDNGKTWQEYIEPIDISIINNYVIIAKTEAKEGKIIEITKPSYPYIVADSLLSATKNSITSSGYYTIAVEDEEYDVHAYVQDEDLTISENTIYGDEGDVATKNDYAKHMVILKVNGNLTIEEGATLTAYNNEYGGPKGMLVYTENTLTNEGTISMTARGAKAEGQNVYLYKNKDNTYEYVPKVGAIGGEAKIARESQFVQGSAGNDGEGRQTGGGGSGSANGGDADPIVYSGVGSSGTSYSGGAGGGSCNRNDYVTINNSGGENAHENGGAGGAARGYRYSISWATRRAGGGAGNPGGKGAENGFGNSEEGTGENGTGGLLIIYSNAFNNLGNIESNGSKGGTYGDTGGGSSGGGSINIFYNQEFNQIGRIVTNGGKNDGRGSEGGNGTVSTGSIFTGNYIADKESKIIKNIEFEISEVQAIDCMCTITVNSIHDDYISEYIIYLSENGKSKEIITNLNELKIEGLKSGTQYDIYVVAYDKEGKIRESTKKKFNTIDADALTIDYANNTYNISSTGGSKETTDQVRQYLFDGNTNNGGTYKGLMLIYFSVVTSGASYWDITVTKNIKIYAYGHKYSDTGGSSGANAVFKKYDGSKYNSYKSCKTYTNGERYELVQLEPGKYRMTAASNYLNFDEWEIEIIN